MKSSTQTMNNSSRWWKIARVVVLLAVAAILAFFTYKTVNSLVVSWEITSLPGLAIVKPTATGEASEGTVPLDTEENPAVEESVKPIGLVPDPWDGASRVTVLVLGLDYNDWRNEEGPPRTDSMILLTLDPISMTAGMLSIPRDLREIFGLVFQVLITER